MIEMHRLKSVVIFIQTILSFVAIKKNYNSKFDLKIKELLHINWRKPDEMHNKII